LTPTSRDGTKGWKTAEEELAASRARGWAQRGARMGEERKRARKRERGTEKKEGEREKEREREVLHYRN